MPRRAGKVSKIFSISISVQPPLEEGGMERIQFPRKVPLTGSRSMALYDRKSS